MKKRSTRIICSFCTCCAVLVFAASAKTAYVVKNDSATHNSASVGLATEANYYAAAYNTSSESITARMQAAQPGMSFSTIQSATLKSGQKATGSSGKQASSSFRLQLSGSGKGEGYVNC